MKTNLPQKSYNNGDSSKLDFLSSLNNSTRNQLTVFSLKNFSQEKSILNLPEFIDENICICPLPDNKVFCYGNLSWNNTESRIPSVTGLTFIINPDLSIEILEEGIKCYGSGGVFYDGNVYVYGGYNDIGVIEKIASKYNFQDKNWKIISSLPVPSSFCSCVEYMGLILVGGASRSNKIFAYDIATNSYSEFLSEIEETKILCKSNGHAYIINPGGFIYESENNNPFVWKSINKCEWSRDFCDLIGFQMVFENYFYFIEYEYGLCNYYRFDLVRKCMDFDTVNNWLRTHYL
ncbi:unnamed protein product [Blepharisma stoltei]|uniref:Uncharacterized protein n=1 Tax=Blepharisma stoltei TaxID=1481888 RepID=A0AAU9J869_9CILI|nr:unnamed protein product [Blepharisma stoltei]